MEVRIHRGHFSLGELAEPAARDVAHDPELPPVTRNAFSHEAGELLSRVGLYDDQRWRGCRSGGPALELLPVTLRTGGLREVLSPRDEVRFAWLDRPWRVVVDDRRLRVVLPGDDPDARKEPH